MLTKITKSICIRSFRVMWFRVPEWVGTLLYLQTTFSILLQLKN
ncbi:hypothetical protein RIR_e17789_A0A2N1NNV9_9GLOM [Rhizophagus irregularis DAOM 181602=DAOM 197198]|nr:hypothetical protein RIR_e17789_A0A2N1NNV9_9GLOM [Rhizophagus irregularis DAOM 181602=DAOM 197198]